MAEGNVDLTMRVQWRDPFGQFAERIREGADTAAYDLAKEGAALSAAYAPQKTKRLMKAVKAVKGLSGQARWVVQGDPKLLRIAAAQETGARPHDIESHGDGPLANKEDGFFARSGKVRHPGNPATWFMKRARLEVARKAVVTVAKRMPKGRA
jgi:hypothetical protein